MKVSKAVELLNAMKPDDEIIIEIWDKDCFRGAILDTHGNEVPISQNLWNEFASDFTVRDTVIETVGDDIMWGLQDYWNLNDELTKEVK